MAKSLRSKWKRRMRAIKRERYSVKELKQLKTIIDNVENKDIDMSDICTVLPEGTLSKVKICEKEDSQESENNQNSVPMEVEGKSKYHRVKLTNEHGQYPVWMNQKAIKKHKARLTKLGIIKKKNKKNKRKK